MQGARFHMPYLLVHAMFMHACSCVSCNYDAWPSHHWSDSREDRCLKLWDLARGYTLRSVPCAKMPIVVACSRDGNTIITGETARGVGRARGGCMGAWTGV